MTFLRQARAPLIHYYMQQLGNGDNIRIIIFSRPPRFITVTQVDSPQYSCDLLVYYAHTHAN